MARAPSGMDEAALDAAALLRRLGFFGLFVVVPVTAQVTRRATVVLAPIAVILLIIASAIDKHQRPLRAGIRQMLRAPSFLAGMLLLVWAALSIAWTPFPGLAIERIANTVATILLTLAGYLALPDRMRSANLYLIPLGVGAACAVAVLIGLFGNPVMRETLDGDSTLERGAILIALLLWPAVAWLRSRERDTASLVLALFSACALLLAPTSIALIATGFGAVVFAMTSQRPGLGTRFTAYAIAGLVTLAPLLPFLARPLGIAALGKQAPGVQSMIVWQKIVASEPMRLVTGHGFETALRGRFVGLLPGNAPTTVLFELWFELGIVGALAAAFALYAAVRRVSAASIPLLPGAMAAFATAFAIGCSGVRPTLAWWLTSVTILALVFVAIERGQFRTHRPKASQIAAARGGGTEG